MGNILKEFAKQFTIDYARQRIALKEANIKEDPSAYRGGMYFPSTTVNELTFEYWKDLHLLPVMAKVQAFGAEAEIASREGHEKIAGEIPTIKRKIPLTGRALIALRREGVGDLDFVRNTLYNDLDNMIDACLARVEMMRMEALTTGQIVLKENGVLMTVEYGVSRNQKEILASAGPGPNPWNDHEHANPIQDMGRWIKAIRKATGIVPTRALTSSEVLENILMNQIIRKMFYGDNGGTRPIAINDLNAVLKTKGLPVIDTYDVHVRTQDAQGKYHSNPFFPEDKFILMPEGKLGDTLLGPTEEAMLDVEVQATEMAGAFGVVYQEMEPPMIWTKAAMTAIPTFPMADAVFMAKVLEAAG